MCEHDVVEWISTGGAMPTVKCTGCQQVMSLAVWQVTHQQPLAISGGNGHDDNKASKRVPCATHIR